MKFFFPDAADLVDPTFDFESETRSPDRVRQRDDRYAHEVFDEPPLDGILVSKAIVEAPTGGVSRYTIAQRHRLYREGIRRYFRLDRDKARTLETIGDCGAFSYVKEKEPPFSVDEVLDFYSTCDFDYGISVDHVILGFRSELDGGLPGVNVPPPEWRERRELTLDLGRDFLARHRERGERFEPVGVAQGWSPESYADSFRSLQAMGFSYIAIGGIVPLKTPEIVASLEAVNAVRKSETRIHLLGVTRVEEVARFEAFGVASFDSTSPLRRAFKDDRDNYYTMDGAFSAIRVPQVDGNNRLQMQIRAGKIDQDAARSLESECLSRLLAYDREDCDIDAVLGSLEAYDRLLGGRRSRTAEYRAVLEARPWRECSCNICKEIGVHVILFRGAERNRRRGFHNLYVANKRLHRALSVS